MKIKLCLAALLIGTVVFVSAQSGTIHNAWSGVSGDKANMAAVAFQADAGIYPDSITPAGALVSPTALWLDALTLTRPDDTTSLSTGTGARQTTSVDTPVYVDVYSTYDSVNKAFSDYLGSSSTSVAWSQTVQNQDYTFGFSGITLQSNQKYWFVFSEDNIDGEVSNFRMKVNTAGDDATVGQGKGYLVGDTVQGFGQNNNNVDWGTAYTVSFTVIPEPAIGALVALGGLVLFFRKRS